MTAFLASLGPHRTPASPAPAWTPGKSKMTISSSGWRDRVKETGNETEQPIKKTAIGEEGGAAKEVPGVC